MENNKYKILVLSDLKKSTSTILKNAIRIAKIIGADIEFFYVKKPVDIIEKDNQLSAIRTINDEYKVISKKIHNLIEPISKEHGITINSTFAFGNVKNEIGKYIKETQPDIIVLGKRKSKSFNFVGDNITQFVLNEHSGIVVLTTNKSLLEPNKNLSLGLLNCQQQPNDMKFVKDLIDYTERPLKSFEIVTNSGTVKVVQNTTEQKTVKYVFEQNDDTVKNISKYASKNNIDLLCIDRENINGANAAVLKNTDIKEFISKLNISLLLTGK